MCVVANEPACKVHQHVVATAVGSAKGWLGKDLTTEEKVWATQAPVDPEGESRLESRSPETCTS